MMTLSSFNKLAALAHFLAFSGFLVVAVFFLKRKFSVSDIVRLGATAPPAGESIDTINYNLKLEKVVNF
jgi:hypothetical protein